MTPTNTVELMTHKRYVHVLLNDLPLWITDDTLPEDADRLKRFKYEDRSTWQGSDWQFVDRTMGDHPMPPDAVAIICALCPLSNPHSIRGFVVCVKIGNTPYQQIPVFAGAVEDDALVAQRVNSIMESKGPHQLVICLLSLLVNMHRYMKIA